MEVLHERPHAAVELEGARPSLLTARVDELDADPAVQERQLAQPRRQHVEAELDLREHLRVRFEPGDGAVVVGAADFPHRGVGRAALVALLVDRAVAMHGHLAPERQRVDHGYADAVQAAGDLVALLVELAAGVEPSHHHLEGADAFGRMNVGGNAAPVVGDADHLARLYGDLDLGAVPDQRFVDAVVHHLVHEVVQSFRARGADVHAGPLADVLQAFEHLDVLRGIVLRHEL